MFTASASHAVNDAVPVSSPSVPEMMDLSSPLITTSLLSSKRIFARMSTLLSFPVSSEILFLIPGAAAGLAWTAGASDACTSLPRSSTEPLLPMFICTWSFQILVYAPLNA